MVKNYSDSSVLKNLDIGLLVAVVFLCVIGLVMVASSSMPRVPNEPWSFVTKQFMALGIGTVIALAVLHIPLKVFMNNRGKIILFAIVLLGLVLLVGTNVNGATRWIRFGGFNFQPAEAAKLAVVIFLSGYLAKFNDQLGESFGTIVRLILPFGAAGIFLLLEPDFGSVFVIIMISAGVLILAGAPWRYFLYIVLPLGLALFLAVYTSDYRMNRIYVFFDPWASPFGSGYQMVQALIASGSGGWTGLGLGNSIQKMLYLPDAHTDFIFSVYAEEFGFIGVVFLIGLYLWLTIRIFSIGRFASDKKLLFAANLCYGVAIWIMVQMGINIGGNLGLLPSKGLTLPFISYGGSSIIVFCIAIALVFRVYYEALMAPEPESAKEVDNSQAKDVSEDVQNDAKSEESKPKSKRSTTRRRKSA